jgi:hypothetical protein
MLQSKSTVGSQLCGPDRIYVNKKDGSDVIWSYNLKSSDARRVYIYGKAIVSLISRRSSVSLTQKIYQIISKF